MSGTSAEVGIKPITERTFAMVRIEEIDVVTSRGRGQRQFKANVRSIADNGLYKPILVNALDHATTGRYQLICGEGRLLAHIELKREKIKAEIVNVPLATAHIMSLGENMTKCPPQAIEYAYALLEMHQQGTTFKDLERQNARFDLVVLDPPSFTKSKGKLHEAMRGYKEIHLRALKLLEPEGLLATFCCSHHVDRGIFIETINEAAVDARKTLRQIGVFGQALDHPIISTIPETEYLKGYLFELVPGR